MSFRDKNAKILTYERNEIFSNSSSENIYNNIDSQRKFVQNIYLAKFFQLGNYVKNNKGNFCNSQFEKIKAVYHFFQSLIIISLICPMLCSYNISLTTIEINESVYYPILNTRYIGKPIEIYINDSLLTENSDFKYKDYYLYIRSNYKVIDVLLVWNESIAEVELNEIVTTDLLFTEENSIDKTDQFTNNERINTFINEDTKDFIFTNNELKKTDEDELFQTIIQSNQIYTNKMSSFQNKEEISESIFTENLMTTEITYPNTITSTEITSESAFPSYSSDFFDYIEPKKINLNAKNMFRNCKIIKEIDFSFFDVSRIFNMEHMFDSCTSLTSVLNFFPENVQDMSYLFHNCISLTYVEFNNTANLTYTKAINMEFMFSNCISLPFIDLEVFKTKNVVNMNSMFYECQNLNSINFGDNFDTSLVTNMEHMFDNCISLVSLDLQTFKLSNVENTKYMFYNCINLGGSITLNSATPKVKNMEFMFYNCVKLDSLNLKNFDNSKVENMRYMFCN